MINILRTAAFAHRVFANAAAGPEPRNQAPRQWFTMKATSDDTAEILIYDEIGASYWNDNAVTAQSFNDELKALGDGIKKINLRINSPGGDVFDGIAIHNMLKAHPAKVTASIDGIAASIASVIAMAGDTIIIPENGFMLIHNASAFAIGTKATMEAMAQDLERIDQAIIATYVARSSSDEKTIRNIMDEDRLMNAAEAKELGLVDEVRTSIKMAAKFSLRLLPEAAAVAFKAAAEIEPSAEPSPPEASEGGDAGGSVEPPAPSLEQPSNVIELKTAAKAEGREEHVRYVNEVLDICNLAKMPDQAAGFIKAGTDLKVIRAKLLETRAAREEAAAVNPHVPAAIAAAGGAGRWSAVIKRMGFAKAEERK